MQTLFEHEKMPDRDVDVMLARNIKELGSENVDEPFAVSLLSGTCAMWDATCDALKRHAPEWPLERMDPISRAVLMISSYELLFGNDAPDAVVMDEAIEVAKEYGTAESAKFVNGVLNAIAKGKNAHHQA